jgi:hypothetical protein
VLDNVSSDEEGKVVMSSITDEAPNRLHKLGLIGEWTTERGMRVSCYELPLEALPVDFFADPDGYWTYETLADAAGFSLSEGVAFGALKQPFCNHPDGAAVVTLNAATRPYVAIVECPIAYQCSEPVAERSISAA